MKVAVCFFGLPRYSDYILESFQKNVLALYDVDIYGHFWWSEEMVGTYKHREFFDTWDKDTMDVLQQKLTFKKVVIEPQIKFDLSGYKHSTTEPDLQVLTTDMCKDILFGNKSKWYSTQKAYKLIENPSDYDFIIISRLDCDYSKPIDLEVLKRDILYLQDGYRGGGDRKYNDVYAIGSPEVIHYYADIYNLTDKYHKDGLIHLHIHFEKLMTEDIPVPHVTYPFGVWIMHPSLFHYRRSSPYLTNHQTFLK